MKTYKIKWNGHCLELGRRTCVMGILNVTPDSFSDGGKFLDTETAVLRGIKMVQDGADIIDIGGESTRPFSKKVLAEEEAARVVPVIKKLAVQTSVPVSIDTAKSEVAKQAIEAGAAIINDISALQADPKMADVAAQYNVPVVLMHMKGTPQNMQIKPQYDDLFGEIKYFFKDVIEYAIQKGISRDKLIIDPGIGFGKTQAHNLSLLKHLERFSDLNLPILIGASRKAFIRRILSPDADINPLTNQVEIGTQATVAASVLNGAHIVRVHNVANTSATTALIDAVRN